MFQVGTSFLYRPTLEIQFCPFLELLLSFCKLASSGIFSYKSAATFISFYLSLSSLCCLKLSFSFFTPGYSNSIRLPMTIYSPTTDFCPSIHQLDLSIFKSNTNHNLLFNLGSLSLYFQ